MGILYCTDERIAVRAFGDFPRLCPRTQRLAFATNGAFSGSDRWTLTSAGAEFEARGISKGHILQLTQPEFLFGGGAGLIAVESATGDTATLRRIGMEAGQGAPPSPADGLGAVTFACDTLGPQIERASRELDRLYGVAAKWGLLSAADQQQVSDACVLYVLADQYLAAATHSGEIQDDFISKHKYYQRLFQEKADSVLITSDPTGAQGDQAGWIFGNAGR